jgi:heme-degrading monooxygenase HmoA
MSVIMTMRVKADPSKLEAAMADRWQEINERAKQHGCMHHRFLVSEDGTEVAVVDEWETKEGFQRFFAASDDIRQMMAEVGVTTEPTITFWNTVDSPDQF